MFRRSEMALSPDGSPDVIEVSDLKFDFKRHQASRDSVPLVLKPKESQLLFFLVRHPGQVFTREQLLDQVWGYESAAGTRTVDVHVRWLREKIEAEPGAPRHIQTVRGVGYRFEI